MAQEGGMWFFYTREGTLEGPFDGQMEAVLQLDKYIKVMNSGLLPEQELDHRTELPDPRDSKTYNLVPGLPSDNIGR